MTSPTPPAVEVGTNFVSNYPPFSAWSPSAVPAVREALAQPPRWDAPLGVYVHIPFCRKRCRFCYFKVYTDVPSADVRAYLDGLAVEARRWAALPVLGGRRPSFVYFGGGTPSYLSGEQLDELFSAVRGALPWADGAEVTFECEPGTLRQPKLDALARHGVTRLSLGVESFDAEVLEINGRAHSRQHIAPAFQMARSTGFSQINLDLIAGMVGESPERFLEGVDEAIALGADSVTIYQMEIPGNTALFKAAREGADLGGWVPDVATRREMGSAAFQRLIAAGYRMSSGYTAVRGEASFVYRDSLWHGADLVPLGVSAFGHVQGVHVQNARDLATQAAGLEGGGLPIARGYTLTTEERLIRELVLQLKLGRMNDAYFVDKFGVSPRARWAEVWASLVERGLATPDGDNFRLTWDGLMRVDKLLPGFFLSQHAPAAEVA
jgi:oxygen-independent coproporphyrinogen-3 oxidase